MENAKIERIKLAIDQFYFNERIEEGLISDKEYDQLAKEYEAETGESVKKLIPIKDSVIKAGYFKEIAKEAVEGSLMERAYQWAKDNNEEILVINPKYDGCSIQAIYSMGRLKHVLSTADLGEGINRTRNFINFFPERVSPWIQAIQGEVIVDATNHGELARNAANGLTNSKYKVDECEKEAFIRIYNLSIDDRYFDSNQCNPDLTYNETVQQFLSELSDSLDEINNKFGRIAIDTATDLELYQYADLGKPLCHFGDGILTQVDGIVVYTKNTIKAFKFYYTESAITTVKEVYWNKKPNGSYAPVLGIDPVVLSNKNISNVSANGVPNLISSKMGVGAKVKVILANTTIPKVIEVLEPSENYHYPKCSCGYQMSEKDIYGSTLKCGADGCDDKMNAIQGRIIGFLDQYTPSQKFDNYVDYLNEFLSQNLFRVINCMSIDRWESSVRCYNETRDTAVSDLVALVTGIDNVVPGDVVSYLHNHFWFSWTADQIMKIMAYPFILALNNACSKYFNDMDSEVINNL